MVDEQWCFVGSANFDTRSFTLNFEINIEVYCPATAQAVSGKIVRNFQKQLLASDLKRRSSLVQLRDNAARLWPLCRKTGHPNAAWDLRRQPRPARYSTVTEGY